MRWYKEMLNDTGAIEEAFVNSFIAKNLKGRWLTRLKTERTRGKLFRKLAHSLLPDLDPRFVYEENAIPPETAKRIKSLLTEWKEEHPDGLCHVMAHSERDKQKIDLGSIDDDYYLTFGAIIIVIPDKLAYYRTERSNLSKQPFYVLFRP